MLHISLIVRSYMAYISRITTSATCSPFYYFEVLLFYMLCIFSPSTPVACTNNIDRHDIAEILLKVALNTIIPYYCVVT